MNFCRERRAAQLQAWLESDSDSASTPDSEFSVATLNKEN